MAKIVKCKICEERFDREKIEAVDVGGRRYAHKTCAEGYTRPQDEIDLEELHKYMMELFKDEYNFVALDNQIKSYKEKYKFTYSGILKTLIYWYDVLENTVDKSYGRIGIVPYVYPDAKKYYYELYMAQEVNKGKDLRKHKQIEVIEIKIKPPSKDVAKRIRLFNLDD